VTFLPVKISIEEYTAGPGSLMQFLALNLVPRSLILHSNIFVKHPAEIVNIYQLFFASHLI
jgi:hypothetical protein